MANQMVVQTCVGEIKLNGIKAVLFDLDGTLIDSLDLHIESFQWIMKILGKSIPAEELEDLMGKTPQDIIGKYFADLPKEILWDAAMIKERFLGTIIEEVYVYPGIKNFLSKLKNLKIKRVVISSTHGELVKKLLEKAGLLDLIDAIVSGDEITNGKPDPEPFRKGIEKLNLPPECALAIGDSIFDGQSSIAAGIKFLGIKTGKTTEEEFEDAGITKVIENIDSISII